MFSQDELATYSQLQIDILKDKKLMTYKEIGCKYGFSSNQQIEGFLFRTVLCFHL